MSRLLPETIKEMLVKHSQGMAISKIAKEYLVDTSTVRYHVEKFERVYGTTSNVYCVVQQVQRMCHHPSMKCLVCGVAQDAIHRRELEEIIHLKTQLEEAKAILERYGHVIE